MPQDKLRINHVYGSTSKL